MFACRFHWQRRLPFWKLAVVPHINVLPPLLDTGNKGDAFEPRTVDGCGFAQASSVPYELGRYTVNFWSFSEYSTTTTVSYMQGTKKQNTFCYTGETH